MKERMKLEELLVSESNITDKELDEALEIEEKQDRKLGEILVSRNIVNEDEMIKALEKQLGISYVDLSEYSIDKDMVTILPESMARKYHVLAIDRKDEKVLLAMADPLNIVAIDDIKLYLKEDITTVIANKDKIIDSIDRMYSRHSARQTLEEFEERFTPTEAEGMSEEEQLEISSAPIVRLLNSIIEQAVKDRTSDIHIEPYKEEIRLRFRIDGDLREIMTLPKSSLAAIITRIKIIGGMDIAERRVPQDGRVETIVDNRDIDMRISTLPTVYGEKVVIRLLDRSNSIFDINKLGFTEKDLDRFKDILSQPYGMLLVTGPTGSGKSTTLYTVLQDLNTVNRNTITVEDPVEYKLKGINQVQVNSKAGLTFASGLRSILRQDPDTVMVGEIRDEETSQIAVRAAITGHLVLSTLHTNDSPSTVARLVDMGVDPYLVASAVIGIVSQRLVKVLCPNCKKSYSASEHDKRLLGLSSEEEIILYKPVGCNNCNGGYKGRTAVHELMPVSENIRKEISSDVDVDKIREIALKEGMTTLLQSASKVALEGRTSIDEVLEIGFTLD